MDRFCAVTRFLASWLGIFEVIGILWREAEKMQFGADIFQSSIVDTVICVIIALALNLLLVYGEEECY